jgi:hypothetical protein
MAPGVVQNSETIINNTIDVITGSQNGRIIDKITGELVNKICPADSFNPSIGATNLPGDEIKEKKKFQFKKPPRKVIRPKVLKNHESRDYLYDRLYDFDCPRSVSSLIFIVISTYVKISAVFIHTVS